MQKKGHNTRKLGWRFDNDPNGLHSKRIMTERRGRNRMKTIGDYVLAKGFGYSGIFIALAGQAPCASNSPLRSLLRLQFYRRGKTSGYPSSAHSQRPPPRERFSLDALPRSLTATPLRPFLTCH